MDEFVEVLDDLLVEGVDDLPGKLAALLLEVGLLLSTRVE